MLKAIEILHFLIPLGILLVLHLIIPFMLKISVITSFIATPKKGWQFWRPHPRDFWYIGSEINKLTSAFRADLWARVRMIWGPLVQSFGGCNDHTQLAGMRSLPWGMTKLDHWYKLSGWDMGNFICFESHLEARAWYYDSLWPPESSKTCIYWWSGLIWWKDLA